MCIRDSPIREEFATLSKTAARANMGLNNKLTLCIMGGSQGAKSINNTCLLYTSTCINHFSREVYANLAGEVQNIINKTFCDNIKL